MKIDPSELSRGRNYFLLISALVPRPIAWVTSCDAAGRVNLAPFSFFQGVGVSPPTVMLSFAARRDGSLKDTPRNILAAGEFVVNLATENDAGPVEQSARDFPPEVSEAEELGLGLLPSTKVAPPRLAGAPVSMECRLARHLELAGCTVIFGEVLLYHLAGSVLDERGLVDPEKLRPLARLGGSSFATLGRVFDAPGSD